MTKGKGGRPPRTDNPVRLTVHVPAALKKKLLHRAIEESRPAGDVVRDALRAYLAQAKKAHT